VATLEVLCDQFFNQISFDLWPEEYMLL
jgi:hypothetical protein